MSDIEDPGLGIVSRVIDDMEVNFTSEEDEALAADEQFVETVALYLHVSTMARHPEALRCNQRLEEELERALRAHAQRVIGEVELGRWLSD